MKRPIEEQIFSLVKTNTEFSVNFDDLWRWVGYSRKNKAREALIKNFERDLEFCTSRCKTPIGGRPNEIIMLTIDAAKQFCMLAGTDKGKQIRKYFIFAEKEWRASINVDHKPELPPAKEIREAMKPAQNGFQAWCIAHKLNAATVHDFITENISGRKAWQSRQRYSEGIIKDVVGSRSDIGLDCCDIIRKEGTSRWNTY